MKLYVHLIYLLGLLCFWEMVIQPEDIRHEENVLENALLSEVEINTLNSMSNNLLEEIYLTVHEYPTESGNLYASRASSGAGCYEEAKLQLPNLGRGYLERFLIDYYETFKNLTDNDDSFDSANCHHISEIGTKNLGKLIHHNESLVKNDFLNRMAMLLVESEYYYLRKVSVDKDGFNKICPTLFLDSGYQKSGEPFKMGVSHSGFLNSKNFYPVSLYLRQNSGYYTIDTIFRMSGKHEIPFQIWRQNPGENYVTRSFDTVKVKVFPQ